MASTRTRLSDLNPHLHCSVRGTCLGTAELRKAMAGFIDVQGASDLHVHHEAVRLTSDDARVAKLLHKTLDKRHEATVHPRRLLGASDAHAVAPGRRREPRRHSGRSPPRQSSSPKQWRCRPRGKLGTPFVPLRTASVASFAAAVAELGDTRPLGVATRDSSVCLRHG